MNLSCPHCYLVSQPVCKTIKSKSLPHQNVDPYHSEPLPTGILPSISPGHLGHLFPPKQVERENDWVSQYHHIQVLISWWIILLYMDWSLSNYLESQSPDNWSPHKHSLGTQGQSLQDISAFSHTSIEEDFHLPFHSLHNFWQNINLWKEKIKQVTLDCCCTVIRRLLIYPTKAESAGRLNWFRTTIKSFL